MWPSTMPNYTTSQNMQSYFWDALHHKYVNIVFNKQNAYIVQNKTIFKQKLWK